MHSYITESNLAPFFLMTTLPPRRQQRTAAANASKAWLPSIQHSTVPKPAANPSPAMEAEPLAAPVHEPTLPDSNCKSDADTVVPVPLLFASSSASTATATSATATASTATSTSTYVTSAAAQTIELDDQDVDVVGVTTKTVAVKSKNSTKTTSTPTSTINSGKQKKTGKGRKKGAKGWTPEKLDLMLDMVQATLPRGHRQWEYVTGQYNMLAQESSSEERIINKFRSLTGQTKPTGCNTRPEHVTRALQLESMMDSLSWANKTDPTGDANDGEDSVDVAMRMNQETPSDSNTSTAPSSPSTLVTSADSDSAIMMSSPSSISSSEPSTPLKRVSRSLSSLSSLSSMSSTPPSRFPSARNQAMKKPKLSIGQAQAGPDLMSAAEHLGQKFMEGMSQVAEQQKLELEVRRLEIQLRRDELEWQKSLLKNSPHNS